MNTKRFSYL